MLVKMQILCFTVHTVILVSTKNMNDTYNLEERIICDMKEWLDTSLLFLHIKN